MDPEETLRQLNFWLGQLDELRGGNLKNIRDKDRAVERLEELSSALSTAQERADALIEWLKRGGYWPPAVS